MIERVTAVVAVAAAAGGVLEARLAVPGGTADAGE